MGSRSAIVCASLLAVALSMTGCKNCCTNSWFDDNSSAPPTQPATTNQRTPQGAQATSQGGQQPAWATPPAWSNPPARMTPPATSLSMDQRTTTPPASGSMNYTTNPGSAIRSLPNATTGMVANQPSMPSDTVAPAAGMTRTPTPSMAETGRPIPVATSDPTAGAVPSSLATVPADATPTPKTAAAPEIHEVYHEAAVPRTGSSESPKPEWPTPTYGNADAPATSVPVNAPSPLSGGR